MKFTREVTSAITIQNVSNGGIRIGKETYRETIALTNAAVLDNWRQRPVAELTPDDLAPLLDAMPDVIVLGTGDTCVFAPRQVTFALARKGVGLEVMDTAAAARTYNVLVGEGRRVAALLYL